MLPDPGADPTIYVPDYEHYDDAPRGSLPSIGNLPDSSGPVTPMNHNNYITIGVTLTTCLPLGFGWLVGDAEWGIGIARGTHGGELGEFFDCGGAMTPGATNTLMAAYLTWRGIPPPRSLQLMAQRAQQPHVPPPQPGTYGNAAVARMMARGTRFDSPSSSSRRTATITTPPPRSRATTATRATNVRARAPLAATSSTSSSQVVLVQLACHVPFHLQSCPPGRWGEACSARGIRENDGVVVVRVRQAARRRWSVSMDVCPPFCGGPRRVCVRSESPGSIQAHPLADDFAARWVHADIVVVPLVALCQIALHILEQVRFLRVECGPLDRLPVLYLGASVFNRVGGGLRRGAAVFGQHQEDDGRVLVSHVPRWNLHSALALGPHATVAMPLSAARSKCLCSHQCCSGVAWVVGMGW